MLERVPAASNGTHERGATERNGETSRTPARRNRAATWGLLAVLLTVQLLAALPRFGELNYANCGRHYDNALFLLFASVSNDDSIRDARKFFGLAKYVYDDNCEPAAVEHYSRHPVLSPTLTRLCARVFGHTETTIRAYALFLSLLATALLFLLLSQFISRPAPTFFLGLLYVFVPMKFMYMDCWCYYTAVEVMILATLLSLWKARTHRWARFAFLACFFLLFHTDWPAYIAAAGMFLYLCLARDNPGWRGLAFRAALVGAIGVLSSFLIQGSLGFFEQMRAGFVRQTVGLREEMPSLMAWVHRQRLIIDRMFGQVLAFAGLAVGALLVRRRALFSNFLLVAACIVIGTSLVYVGVFAHAAYVHDTAHWFLALGSVLLLGGFLAYAEDHGYFDSAAFSQGTAISLAVLVMLVSLQGVRVYRGHLDNAFGTPGDVIAVRSLDKRFVVFCDGDQETRKWWDTTLMPKVVSLYSDPAFRRSENGGVQFVEDTARLDVERDAIVMPNRDGAESHFLAAYGEKLGVRTLELAETSPNFRFYRFTLNEKGTRPSPVEQ